jgi:hypothetical protein
MALSPRPCDGCEGWNPLKALQKGSRQGFSKDFPAIDNSLNSNKINFYQQKRRKNHE